MRKGYRKGTRPGLRLWSIPFIFLFLCLAWIWKADRIKEYYSAMKYLEGKKGDLVSENSRLKGSLMELKSLSEINKVITGRFGLTQNVSQRIFLFDPVKPEEPGTRFYLVDMEKVTDWLEGAVFRSGQIVAEEREGKSPKRK